MSKLPNAIHSISGKSIDLASRTVHVRLHPAPRNLSERREVLRVLEQYGDVSTFRSFQYHPKRPDPTTFLSILSTKTSTQNLLNASPIRYELVTSSSSTTPTKTSFELSISPSKFSHDLHLSSPVSSPLHGPYTPTPPKKSLIGSILSYSLPDTIAAPGLRDWETDVRVWRQAYGGVDGTEGEGGTGKNANVSVRTLEARERKRMEAAVPEVMKGLRGLRKEEDSTAQGGQPT